jgi:predicted lipid-binding transport protein (Tim44 family)
MTMKRFLLSLSVAVLCFAMLAPQVEAKRLGGGGTSGMRRDMPRKAPDAPTATPNNAPSQTPASPNVSQAAPGAAAGAAAAAPRRSWMGPIAGLAAGFGLAALMSHMGLGGELANFVMLALLVVVGFVVVRFLMRRFGPQPAQSQGLQFANAPGADVPTPPAAAPWASGGSPLPLTPVAAAPSTAAVQLPAGFDTPGFERTAKLIFIRMQAANDVGDLNDLRAFTTPEMFAAAKLDLQERGSAAQQTDVVKLDAAVIDFAQEAAQQIVSVRFHGLIREEKDSAATPFDEVWHLVKPLDGSREWAIAGIAPYV